MESTGQRQQQESAGPEAALRSWLRVPSAFALPGWAARRLGKLSRALALRRDGRPLDEIVFGIVDLETTGLSAASDRILEIGLVVERARRTLGRFSTLVDPGQPIPALVTRLTGIHDADVAGAPGEAAALELFAAVLREQRVDVLVAHNARFDRTFLRKAWRTQGRRDALPRFLCSLRLARCLVNAPGYGLDRLVAELSIPEATRHRALGDAEMASWLWRELLCRAHRRGIHTLDALYALERRGRRRRRVWRATAGPVAALALLGAWVASLAVAPAAHAGGRLATVVVDPGHGGPDFGARGPLGAYEKDVVLAVARRIGGALEARGVRVVHTRQEDEFVSLARRTEIANGVRGDLFLSIHANSAPDPEASGPETYFLSVDASDEESRRLALVENAVFEQPGALPEGADIVGSILGDLIRTEHLQTSSLIAAAIQRKLARLTGSSRGVKQAPFVVLSGVNMPAALIEIGFLTHPEEARRIQSREHQQAVARAIADAIESVRDGLRPLPAEASP